MKKMMCTFIAGMVIVQSVFAETPTITMPVVAPTRGGNIYSKDGTYDIKNDNVNLDKTAVLLEITKQVGENNNVNRQYLLSIIESFENQLKVLVNLKNDFMTLSTNSSMKGEGIDFKEYLAKKNEIVKALDYLNVELQAKTLINKNSLPSQGDISVGGTTASTVTSGNINMEPIIVQISNQANALKEAMNNMTFKLKTPAGDYVNITQDALNPVIKARILDSAERTRLNNEMLEKQTMPAEVTEAALDWDESIANDIKLNIIKPYASEEYLRLETDNSKEAFKTMYDSIFSARWMRSYLRTYKNAQLGVFRVQDYTKKFLNIEAFEAQPIRDALNMVYAQPAKDYNDIKASFENLRNWTELYDEKATPIFTEKESDSKGFLAGMIQKFKLNSSAEQKESKKGIAYASTNGGFFAKANSAVTYLTGQRRAAEILLLVMRMLLADVHEERMAYDGDTKGLVNYFNELYKSTDEMKTWSNSNLCKFVDTLSKSQYQAGGNCAKLGINKPNVVIQNGSGSHLQKFRVILSKVTNEVEANLKTAQSIKELLDADMEAGMTDAEKQQKQTEEDEQFN